MTSFLKIIGSFLDAIPSWAYTIALVVAGVWVSTLKIELISAGAKVSTAQEAKAKAELDLSSYKLEQATSKNDQLVNLAKALTNAKTREADSRAAAAAADAKSAGLLSSLEEANKRIDTATADAVRNYARTQGEVFGACVREYREVGKAAQGHADDVTTLTEAWPKTKGGGPEPTPP